MARSSEVDEGEVVGPVACRRVGVEEGCMSSRLAYVARREGQSSGRALSFIDSRGRSCLVRLDLVKSVGVGKE
jgi:hypothetical protein